MALSHILHAITAEADAEIRSISEQHQATVRERGTRHTAALASIQASVAQRKNDRLHTLRRRAADHVAMKRRHAVLRRKQECLDAVFDDVMKAFAALPDTVLRPMMQRWIASLPCPGILRPSPRHAALLESLKGPHTIGAPLKGAAGGFRFESPLVDRDYTIEFLVREVLRPSCDIDAAHHLFGH